MPAEHRVFPFCGCSVFKLGPWQFPIGQGFRRLCDPGLAIGVASTREDVRHRIENALVFRRLVPFHVSFVRNLEIVVVGVVEAHHSGNVRTRSVGHLDAVNFVFSYL